MHEHRTEAGQRTRSTLEAQQEHSPHSSGSCSSQVEVLVQILVCGSMTPLLGFLQDTCSSLVVMLKAAPATRHLEINTRGKEMAKIEMSVQAPVQEEPMVLS